MHVNRKSRKKESKKSKTDDVDGDKSSRKKKSNRPSKESSYSKKKGANSEDLIPAEEEDGEIGGNTSPSMTIEGKHSRQKQSNTSEDEESNIVDVDGDKSSRKKKNRNRPSKQSSYTRNKKGTSSEDQMVVEEEVENNASPGKTNKIYMFIPKKGDTSEDDTMHGVMSHTSAVGEVDGDNSFGKKNKGTKYPHKKGFDSENEDDLTFVVELESDVGVDKKHGKKINKNSSHKKGKTSENDETPPGESLGEKLRRFFSLLASFIFTGSDETSSGRIIGFICGLFQGSICGLYERLFQNIDSYQLLWNIFRNVSVLSTVYLGGNAVIYYIDRRAYQNRWCCGCAV